MPRAAIALMFCAAGCASGQPTDSKLTFEVASIKPSPRTTLITAWEGGPGPDPGRVTIQNYMLQALVSAAYRVEYDQVTGPDWLDERFDISAKVPPDATRSRSRR